MTNEPIEEIAERVRTSRRKGIIGRDAHEQAAAQAETVAAAGAPPEDVAAQILAARADIDAADADIEANAAARARVNEISEQAEAKRQAARERADALVAERKRQFAQAEATRLAPHGLRESEAWGEIAVRTRREFIAALRESPIGQTYIAHRIALWQQRQSELHAAAMERTAGIEPLGKVVDIPPLPDAVQIMSEVFINLDSEARIRFTQWNNGKAAELTAFLLGHSDTPPGMCALPDQVEDVCGEAA